MNAQRQTLSHGFGPCFDAESRVLILGSFPSVKSRQAQFFYGHPRNRFWTVMAAVCGAERPETPEEKRLFLRRYHIALYDVIESCSIIGSSDSSIRDVVPADLSPILDGSRVGKAIFTNGGKASQLYGKFILPQLEIPARPLPSTSPANAAWSSEKLIETWREALWPFL